MNYYLAPDLNSFMIASLSFCTISPCMEDTVKLASLIFSVNQSTYWETCMISKHTNAFFKSQLTSLIAIKCTFPNFPFLKFMNDT